MFALPALPSREDPLIGGPEWYTFSFQGCIGFAAGLLLFPLLVYPWSLMFFASRTVNMLLVTSLVTWIAYVFSLRVGLYLRAHPLRGWSLPLPRDGDVKTFIDGYAVGIMVSYYLSLVTTFIISMMGICFVISAELGTTGASFYVRLMVVLFVVGALGSTICNTDLLRLLHPLIMNSMNTTAQLRSQSQPQSQSSPIAHVV